jgi:hypothetical protein
MIVPGSVSPLLISQSSYAILNALRLRASNSAYLTRTPGVAGNRTTWTWSAWIKRGAISGANQTLFSANAGADFIRFTTGEALELYFNNTATLTTSALFRDPTGWMHLVVAVDTTQATNTNRIKIYANGTQLTSFSFTNYPGQNTQGAFAAAIEHSLGRVGPGANYLDGYLADVYFIDGQQLTPSVFGQIDTPSGAWLPRRYAGAFGTTGFKLEFQNASSTTTLGNDSSGSSNNWTTSGVSVTSGSTYDQMTDTPTTNYATLNPITTQGVVVSTTNANLSTTIGTAGNRGAVGNTFVGSGKWYWEYYAIGAAATDSFGIISTTGTFSGGAVNEGVMYLADGRKTIDGTLSLYGATYAANDIIGVALDCDGGTVTFYKNNISQGAISMTARSYAAAITTASSGGGGPYAINFGQRPFTYTPPSGYSALSAANIATTTVTTSGSFTGNAAADGPVIWAAGTPATLTINGNAVTFGTHADKLAGGFKLRSSSVSYNASGANTWSATAGNRFVRAKKPNNAQVN